VYIIIGACTVTSLWGGEKEGASSPGGKGIILAPPPKS